MTIAIDGIGLATAQGSVSDDSEIGRTSSGE